MSWAIAERETRCPELPAQVDVERRLIGNDFDPVEPPGNWRIINVELPEKLFDLRLENLPGGVPRSPPSSRAGPMSAALCHQRFG